MRTIKFRGQIEHTNEWVKGYYFETPLTDGKTDSMPEDGWSFLTGKKRHVISRNSCVYQVNPETIGQFTGLFDKNGVEMYEQDIINFSIDNEKYVIQFEEGAFCLVSDSVNGIISIYDFDNSEYEVIGNIHENTELL